MMLQRREYVLLRRCRCQQRHLVHRNEIEVDLFRVQCLSQNHASFVELWFFDLLGLLCRIVRLTLCQILISIIASRPEDINRIDRPLLLLFLLKQVDGGLPIQFLHLAYQLYLSLRRARHRLWPCCDLVDCLLELEFVIIILHIVIPLAVKAVHFRILRMKIARLLLPGHHIGQV